MKQHKWHKEIKAWADGAEIEAKWLADKNTEWEYVEIPNWDATHWEYRIKPQPKESQYLYVYYDADKTDFEFWDKTLDKPIGNKDYMGKIKLEENEDA